MSSIISISGLSKTYQGGFTALKSVDLEIEKGEIFALLGPNGAGKTTMIGIICGLVTPTTGTVTVDGHDILRDFRQTRSRIGLVPQEMSIDMFGSVKAAVSFSRGLFGKAPDPAYVEQVLKDLSLWDKKDSEIRALSGGMKRRVMIAKALAHEPDILFLDEPTAGVDVELRKGMWAIIDEMRSRGVTIILTTHYIEEAEMMADRVGIINRGRLLMVDEKDAMMARLGRTEAHITLAEARSSLPPQIARFPVELEEGGTSLRYRGGDGTGKGKTEVADLTKALIAAGIDYTGIDTRESSLEDIFVTFLGEEGDAA